MYDTLDTILRESVIFKKKITIRSHSDVLDPAVSLLLPTIAVFGNSSPKLYDTHDTILRESVVLKKNYQIT